jgi:glycosyltransferase involved in cell wall biosynthesis
MDESTLLTVERGCEPRPLAATTAGRDITAGTDRGPVKVSVIMPTVFWTGTFERCARRVLSVLESTASNAEVIFAFDGSRSSAPAWLDHPQVRIVKTGTRSGPAIARNLAARTAQGEILFFVDADVELAPGAIDRVQAAFEADPDCVGLFGAYDAEPADGGIATAFRNLLHHHTHVSHAGRVETFWAGCGAMRTAAFHDIGGFDETFASPSVADIELGMRVAANGGMIRVVPDLQCKHLKHWTLASMVVTDIAHRARPWSQLIVNSGRIPATLNIDWRGRASGICSVLLGLCLVASAFVPLMLWAAITCGLVLFALNIDFYRLCRRKRGIGFAAASVALHWLYFVYASLTFGAVAIHQIWLRSKRMAARGGRGLQPAAASAAMMLTSKASHLPPFDQ